MQHELSCQSINQSISVYSPSDSKSSLLARRQRKNYAVIKSAVTSPSKHKFALHKGNNTVAQFIIQQKYSKRQNKASKYTGIRTFSTSPFGITSSDIDV